MTLRFSRLAAAPLLAATALAAGSHQVSQRGAGAYEASIAMLSKDNGVVSLMCGRSGSHSTARLSLDFSGDRYG